MTFPWPYSKFCTLKIIKINTCMPWLGLIWFLLCPNQTITQPYSLQSSSKFAHFLFFSVAQVFAVTEQQFRAQVVLACAHRPQAGDSSSESLSAWRPDSGDYHHLLPCWEAPDMVISVQALSLGKISKETMVWTHTCTHIYTPNWIPFVSSPDIHEV